MNINKTIRDDKTGQYYITLKKALENKVPGSYIVRVWIDQDTRTELGSVPVFAYGSHVNSVKQADASIQERLNTLSK